MTSNSIFFPLSTGICARRPAVHAATRAGQRLSQLPACRRPVAPVRAEHHQTAGGVHGLESGGWRLGIGHIKICPK